MVFDQTRNTAYVQALRAAITPDSVVLDLGAGVGIHGLLAAQLGARKVYLVEPQDVIELARRVAQANGLADRVICLQGRIEDVALPEPVDVIVSALTGNFLLEEDLLPALFCARDRWLKPDGRLIPNAAVMEAVPVSAPHYYQREVEIWSEPQFGLDFRHVRAYAANSVFRNRRELERADFLAEPRPLMNLNFHTAQSADCLAAVDFQVTTAGMCHGWAGWFAIQLGDRWLSTAPHAAPVHWSPVFFPLDEPIELQVADVVRFHLSRPAYGHWSWRVTSDSIDQRHSTFLAQPLSDGVFQKSTTGYRPSPSDRGALIVDIVNAFDGNRTVHQVSEDVAHKHPEMRLPFPELVRLVADLAQRYT
jgi:predicted RNA methylase